MQMLNPQFILMLQLLQFLLWRLLVMFLVLCRWLHAALHMFAYQEDLTVFVIDVFGFYFCPG